MVGLTGTEEKIKQVKHLTKQKQTFSTVVLIAKFMLK